MLNAIEHGRYDQAGGTRVIAATNRDIGQMLGEHTFREDLYYRLCGIKIELPPLHARREDIPALIHSFLARAALARAAKDYGKQLEGVTAEARQTLMSYVIGAGGDDGGYSVTAEARQTLMSYDWPGNVRELKSVIENMVVLSSEKRLGVESLPADVRPKAQYRSISFTKDRASRHDGFV